MTLKEAEELLDSGEPDEAARICAYFLNENPDDPMALYVLARCNSAASRYGVAATLNKRVTELLPNSSHAWNNLGHSYHCLNRFSKAEECMRKAISLDETNSGAYNNLTSVLAAVNNPHEAIKASKYGLYFAQEQHELDHVKESVSLSYLGLKQWDIGWKYYESGLPGKFRRERTYANESRWDGSPGGKIVFYGEQGIGDEIMFASILPDALENCDGIIECDRRLEGLFKRSFPQAKVYGTRFDKNISWPTPDIRGRCAFGSLGRYFRNTTESFPRQPFLVACPQRRRMCRALLDGLPGKKIGLAWTGGTKTSRTDIRSLDAGKIHKLVRSFPNVSFISLEYKDGFKVDGVHDFPFLSRTTDFDDTAALVRELDCVLSVTTASAILAGAVGTSCHVLVPNQPTWHWAYEGEMPWFEMNLHRGEWDLEKITGGIVGA